MGAPPPAESGYSVNVMVDFSGAFKARLKKMTPEARQQTIDAFWDRVDTFLVDPSRPTIQASAFPPSGTRLGYSVRARAKAGSNRFMNDYKELRGALETMLKGEYPEAAVDEHRITYTVGGQMRTLKQLLDGARAAARKAPKKRRPRKKK